MADAVCGVDVHKDLLVATILSESLKETSRFTNDVDGINRLKKWLEANRCKCIVMESSSIYWVSLYLTLEDAEFDVSLANPGQQSFFFLRNSFASFGSSSISCKLMK